MLGVSETSVRRWTSAGVLPVNRTPGGHRRYRLSDIEAMCKMSDADGQQILAVDEEAA